MEIKEIEDSEGKYYIAEDGTMLRALTPRFNKNGAIYHVISKNKKQIKLGLAALLVKYFKKSYCRKCNTEFKIENENSKYSYICETCLRKNAAKCRKDWRKNNPDKIKATKIKNKKASEEITKEYAAHQLGLKISEMPDDVYEAYKKTLFFKREVSKNSGVHINSLNW